MSMSLFMGLQCAGIFLIYMCVTVGLPAFVFGKQFMHLKISERFVAYFIIGNFYVMNLVFILQLLKISNRFTLIVFTVVPSVVTYCRLHGISIKKQMLLLWTSFDRILAEQLGLRTVIYRNTRRFLSVLKKVRNKLIELFLPNFLESLLLIAFFLIFFKIYGIDILSGYGYSASDMPVHNYWINYLSRKKIFVAGVYPFGFHCTIYYLHEVFNIDTYIVLRVFCLTQNFLVIMMLLCLLKYCCKTKYTPYVSIVIYTVSNIFARHTYSRFYSTLPQEFGMLFIYPTIYFAFAFFKEKKEDRPSLWYLCGFAMSFSMTLAVHFYGTMIAGLFCVGIAIGYFSRFIQWKYFKCIIITCVISVVIAVLPMVIAFATGTPLQGSLGWGMKILRGGDDNASTQQTVNENVNETVGANSKETTGETLQGNNGEASQGNNGEAVGEISQGGDGGALQGGNVEAPQGSNGGVQQGSNGDAPQGSSGEMLGESEKIPLSEKIKDKVNSLAETVIRKTSDYIFSNFGRKDVIFFYALVAELIIVGFIMILFRKQDYGDMLISTGVFMLFMVLLLISKQAGLPTLMDPSRCSIYFSYAVPLVVTLAIDSVLYALFGWMFKIHLRWVMHIVSFFVLAAVFIFIQERDMVRQTSIATGLQTNEAVTCLTNIIRENEDFHWTICSANDELRMGEDHGYHYETIDFLRKMEGSGDNAMLTIPTETVYFFIEKRPLDYTIKYEGSGQLVSEEMANRELPRGKGLSIYEGENRCIVMSRMYFWAQEFCKMYPNEMKVYLETEDFVCYKIKQNMYRLYNFAIDYGYNTQDYEQETITDQAE